MDGNDIIIWLSVFVTVCVVIWAVAVIRAYNRIGKE